MPSSKEKDDHIVEFKEFDPAWIRFDDTVLLLGPRKAGKSVAAREILLSQGKPPRGQVQLGSPEGLKSWIQHLPIVFLHQYKEIDAQRTKIWMDEQEKRVVAISTDVSRKHAGWLKKSNDKLDTMKKSEKDALLAIANQEKWPEHKLVRRLQKLKVKYDALTLQESDRLLQKKEKLYDRLVLPESCFCGFDDLGDEKKGVMDNPLMKTLVNTGRHYAALVFVIAQYAKHLSAACRSGTNWLFLWAGSMSGSDLEKVFKDYIPATIFPNKEATMRAFKAITEKDPRNCMVIWRANPHSKKAEDCVFFWNPIAALAKRRGATCMFGDANFKLYSDLYYNGKAGPIQNAVPVSSSPSASSSSSSLLFLSGGKKKSAANENLTDEDRKRLVEQFETLQALDPKVQKLQKQQLLASKQAQNRWKRSENRHRQKAYSLPPQSSPVIQEESATTTSSSSSSSSSVAANPFAAMAEEEQQIKVATSFGASASASASDSSVPIEPAAAAS